MRVHIVLSDTGWILERLAYEIADRYPYVTYGPEIVAGADLYYFVTYNSFVSVTGAKSMALFTHSETEPQAKERFELVAKGVDHAVAMSPRYERMLQAMGASRTSVVRPGVDIDRYKPRLRIGVVGRTYATGRKGEYLVAQVLSHPEIDWVFTGDGWPEPGRRPSDADMPDFYRSLDYLLVPSLWEGGPMSIVEALACGTPVIAPDVGWAEDYPHIHFERGDVESLRGVLDQLVAKKRELASVIRDQTWDAWAETHDALFHSLLGALPSNDQSSNSSTIGDCVSGIKVRLSTSNAEGFARGGPSVRVPRLARDLRVNGLDVVRDGRQRVSVEHVFNVWPPGEAMGLIREAGKRAERVVFSPIFLDLSERRYWDGELLRRFESASLGPAELRDIESTAERMQLRIEDGGTLVEAIPGYFGRIRAMCKLVDALVFLSEREKHNLSRIGVDVEGSFSIKNAAPYDLGVLAKASSYTSLETDLGVDGPFVVSVGRVEPRKNQLLLAHAVKPLDVKLLLVGQTPHKKYAQLIREVLGDRVIFAGQLEHGSAKHISAIKSASVFALPSWAEGAPLAALEAYGLGTPLVLGNRSGEQEYFGESTHYVNPASIEEVREAITNCLKSGRSEAVGIRDPGQQWDSHVSETKDVYSSVVSRSPRRRDSSRTSSILSPSVSVPLPQRNERPRVAFDLTTTRAHSSHLTGISRLEIGLATGLAAQNDLDCVFTAWSDTGRRFVEIPRHIVLRGDLRLYLQSGGGETMRRDILCGRTYLLVGSSWMQNNNMAGDLIDLVHANELRLVPMIMDLIPTLFPYWQRPGSPEKFTLNLRRVIAASSQILTISEWTKRDVSRFAQDDLGVSVDIDCIRLADVLEVSDGGLLSPDASRVERWIPMDGSPGVPYILAVGAVLPRKNYELLHRIWVALSLEGVQIPDLVIVGGVGPEGQRIAETLTQDPRTKGRIHVVDDISDSELISLYDRSLFTTYPSLYEGWGLPVAESLGRGKICIASARSSIPEIAPTLTDLIDPDDFGRWSQRFLMYLRSPGARRFREEQIRAEFVPTDWKAVAESVIDAVSSGIPRLPRKSVYVNELVVLGDDTVYAECGGIGWCRREGDARSPLPSGGQVHLQMIEPALSDLFVAVEGKSELSRASVHIRVEINGMNAGIISWPSGNWSVAWLALPPAFLEEGPIELRLFPESEPGGAPAARIRRLAIVDQWAVLDIDKVFGGKEAHIRLERGPVFDLTRAQPGSLRGIDPETTDTTQGLAVDLRGLTLDVIVPDLIPTGSQLVFRLVAAGGTCDDLRPSLEVDGVTIELRRADTASHDWTGGVPNLGLRPGTHQLRLSTSGLSWLEGVSVTGVGGLMESGCRSILAHLNDASEYEWGISRSSDLGIDWHRAEQDGCWSRSTRANVRLALPTWLAGRWVLSMEIRVAGFPEGHTSQWGTVEVGDAQVSVPFYPGVMQTNLSLPLDFLEDSPIAELDLVVGISALIQPAASGETEDTRWLGTRVGALRLAPWSEDEYLRLNSDVLEAVRRGEFADGFDHYQRFGLQEARKLRGRVGDQDGFGDSPNSNSVAPKRASQRRQRRPT